MTSVSSRRLDAFDQWCLCRIPQIQYVHVAHVTNDKVCHRTNQPPITSIITARRLFVWPHFPADPFQDHSRALRAAINRPLTEWHHRSGRSRRTWVAASNWTSPGAMWASILCGNVHKTNLNLRKSWRQLCSYLCAIVSWKLWAVCLLLLVEANRNSHDFW